MANKINGATLSSAAGSSGDLVLLDGQEATEFSFWEFINQSDVDSDTDSLHSVENGFVSWYTPSAPRSADSGGEIEAEPVLESRDVVDAVNLSGLPAEEEDEGMHEEVEGKETDGDDDLVPWNLTENGFVYFLTAPPPPRSADSGEDTETDPVLENLEVFGTVNLSGLPDEEEEEEEEEEMDEEDEIYGEVNDDLVPWNLRGKFGGRQRMRKLGKRFCSKMVNTKRDRYAYVKRGCVRGKRELEMKA